MQTRVFCNTNFEGIHRYSNAPTDVEFLTHLHRHMFGVKVEMEVFDDDREVEFILLKRQVNTICRSLHSTPGSSEALTLLELSCEQIAKKIISQLREIYCQDQDRVIIVTVDEDGENGATVYSGGSYENEWDDN